MKKHFTINLQGEASELLLMKINKKEFLKLKEFGLPDFDSEQGEEFFDRFESSTYYFEQRFPKNSIQFNLSINDIDFSNMDYLSIERSVGSKIGAYQDLNFSNQGKYILICQRHCSFAIWSVNAKGKFDPKKFDISVNRYNVFNLFDDHTVDLSYDGLDFEFVEGGESNVDTFKLMSADGDVYDL